jgi:hypothetical protein
MTRYIRQAGLAVGDEIILSREAGRYRISHRRKNQVERTAGGVLKLGNGWRVVQL